MDCWRQGLRQKKISLGFSPALRSDTDIVDRNGKKKTKFRFSIIWILTFTISTKEFPIPNHRIVPNDIHPDPKKIRIVPRPILSNHHKIQYFTVFKGYFFSES